MFTRYAIYLTPPPGAFARLGAAWLGWDIALGVAVAHPDIPGIDVAAITKRPRKYGLHGTIVAPFAAARGETEKGLADAIASFCAHQKPFAVDGLKLAQIGRFLALVPAGDVSHLSDLASTAVKAFDRFRAPLSAVDQARRSATNLSDRQRENLRKWGYPHVLEDFRFHMTLTGPLSDADRHRACDALAAHFGDALPAPLNVNSLTLCAEDPDGRFHEINRFALNKTAHSL